MEREFTLKDGRRLRLYQPGAEDAAEMLDYLKIVGGETDFLLFDANGLPYTVQQEAEALERFKAAERDAFFAGRIDGEVACSCNISFYGRKRLTHVAEIAVASQKKFWGIGVGSAIMETLISIARERGAQTIELGVYADNLRAQALYKKFGFVEVGRHKNRFCVNGKYHDEIMMDLYL